MAQVIDFNIAANPSGLNMRTELNGIIEAILTQNSGTDEPLNPFSGMEWVDKSDVNFYYIKKRNLTNDDWEVIYVYDVLNNKITPFGEIAYTIETVNDFINVPSIYKTAIVKDINRGGTFIWSETGTSNGGTVFAGATGYWNRQYSGAINVLWFGAKDTRITGNENYDSYTNIYNALQFIKSINGGSLYFPSGTYKCSQTLYFGGDTGIDESIKIFGDGHQMVFGNSDGGSRLVYTGTTGFLFGLNVDSAGVGQSLFGRLILEDIILLGTGVPTTNELDITCIKGYRSRPTLNRVTIGNFANGITFGGTGYYGADYSDLNTYTNVRFGNIYGNHCMKLYGADNSTIQGVYIEGCDCLIGIEIASTFGVGIKDCLINNVGTGILLKYGGGMFLSNIHSEEVTGSFINTVDIKGLEVNGYYYQTSNTTTSRLLFVGSDTSGGLEDGSTYVEMTNGVVVKDTGVTSDIYIQTKSDYVYIRNTRSVTNAGALRELSISYQDVSTQQFSQNLCKVANESFVYEFTADGTYGTVGKILSIASLFQYATKATLEVINYYSGGGAYASAYYEGIILRESYGISTSTFRLVETKTIAGNATVTNLNGYKPTINATTGELSFYQTNSFGASINYKVVLKMSFI